MDALRGEFETDRQVEFVGEDGLLVGAAVVVCVLVNEDFIVRKRVAGAVGRVGGHGGDPQAAAVVEGKLHRVGEVGEFLFRGKQFHFVTFRHGQCFFRLIAVKVGLSAVFLAGSVVAGDGWQGMGF